MNTRILLMVSLSLLHGFVDQSAAGDKGGRQVRLFQDRTDLAKWDFKQAGWYIADDGSLACRPKGGNIWTKDRFDDFVLELEFKVSESCNSGIFFRTVDIEDPVQTGLEIQILDSYGRTEVGKHDCGAVYDCLPPKVNAVKPAGQWNQIRITARDNQVSVVLNGERIIDMDLNRWTVAGQNPDGTKNKFKTAYKNMKRDGHIGFQDHGHPVWYRNVRITRLK